MEYMALEFQEDFEKDRAKSKFPGGIFFLACQQSTNTLLLMEKLWRDLGCANNESSPGETSRDPRKQESDYEQLQAQKLETLRRKIIAEVKLRWSMLIIIDNAWTDEVVSKLRIPYKHVKYLVTSQKSHLCVGTAVEIRLAKPSMEEARQILLKHSGKWTADQPLEAQAQVCITVRLEIADLRKNHLPGKEYGTSIVDIVMQLMSRNYIPIYKDLIILYSTMKSNLDKQV